MLHEPGQDTKLAARGPAAASRRAERPKRAACRPFGESVKIMPRREHRARPVTLQLTSGQEISGTVTKVGDHVVHLSRIAGRDFYDAVVVLDRVNAVLFKVVGK